MMGDRYQDNIVKLLVNCGFKREELHFIITL